MTNIVKLPSGLIDENIELFSDGKEPKGLYQGSVKHYHEFPAEMRQALAEDMNGNPSAVLALELAGYITADEKLKKYTMCRYGGFDNTPDYAGGTLAPSEYYDCGHRGKCDMEGIVCGLPMVNGRVLSPFETQLIKELATEDTIPVLAQKMGLSRTTFEERKKLLFGKFNVLTRFGLIAEATRQHLLFLRNV